MGTITTPRGRGTRLLAAAAAALAVGLPALVHATPASAATVAVPGLKVTTNLEASTGRGSVLITMTTARSLTIVCNGGVNVNGVKVKIPCHNLIELKITGSSGNDTVDVEGTGFLPLAVTSPLPELLLTMDLGAGNDTAAVRLRTSTADLLGGPGNDTLSAAAYPAAGSHVRTALYGGDGNDRLTNAGYLAGTKPVYGPNDPAAYDYGVVMIGGAGADTITGSNDRTDLVDVDTSDTVALGGGPAAVTVNLTQTTNLVTIDANGNYGPKLAVTTAGKAWNLNLPTLTRALHVNTLGGPDQVTISRKSAQTPISVDTGSGADVLTIRPWTPYSWDQATNTITQPGAQPITWAQRPGSTVKVVPL